MWLYTLIADSALDAVNETHWKLKKSQSPLQKVLSRQEELKERARLLLEQARRDAAMKAGNKSNASAQSPTHAPQIIDVSAHAH